MSSYLIFTTEGRDPDEVEADEFSHYDADCFVTFHRNVPDPGMSGRYIPREWWFGERWEEYYDCQKTRREAVVSYRTSTVLKIQKKEVS